MTIRGASDASARILEASRVKSDYYKEQKRPERAQRRPAVRCILRDFCLRNTIPGTKDC